VVILLGQLIFGKASLVELIEHDKERELGHILLNMDSKTKNEVSVDITIKS
jgi:hypothetical protein